MKRPPILRHGETFSLSHLTRDERVAFDGVIEEAREHLRKPSSSSRFPRGISMQAHEQAEHNSASIRHN